MGFDSNGIYKLNCFSQKFSRFCSCRFELFELDQSFNSHLASEMNLINCRSGFLCVDPVNAWPVLAVEKKRIRSVGNLLPLSIDAIESCACFFMSLALLVGLLVNYLWRVWWVD